MSADLSRLRRALRAFGRAIRKTLTLSFILAMAAMPIPLVPFVALLVKKGRREQNLPTLVVRREESDDSVGRGPTLR